MADDLTCSEEYGTESLVKEDNVDPSQLNSCALDVQRVIQMQLYREKVGGYMTRNADYLLEIQKEGMEASWRRKICHWMFEVCPSVNIVNECTDAIRRPGKHLICLLTLWAVLSITWISICLVIRSIRSCFNYYRLFAWEWRLKCMRNSPSQWKKCKSYHRRNSRVWKLVD